MGERDKRTRNSVLMDYQEKGRARAGAFFGSDPDGEYEQEQDGYREAAGEYEPPVHVMTDEEKESLRTEEIRAARERQAERERAESAADEDRRQYEEWKRARAEEQKKIEERERAKAEEERKRLEEERRKAEEERRQAEEREALIRKKEEEKRQAEEERRQYEEWKRARAEEQKKIEDERRRAEEQKQREADEYADWARKKEEEKRKAEERERTAAEERRSPARLSPFEESLRAESGRTETAGPYDAVSPYERAKTVQQDYGQREQRDNEYSGYDGMIDQPESTGASYRQKMISVYSPKGGVGKTSFSASVAAGFARKDAQIDGRNLRVLLVDFDWEFPDCHTSFGLDPSPNFYKLADVMRNDLKVDGKLKPYYDRRLVESCIIHVNDRLDLLAGSEKPGEHNKLKPDIVQAMLRCLRTLDYDVIVIDNANSAKNITFVALENSDLVLLLSTLDFTTIDEINRFLSTARERQFNTKKLKLVVNAVPAKLGDNIPSPDEVVNLYNIDHIADIPDDPSVREYTNAAEPYMWSGKNTEYTKAVKAMLNKIIPVFPEKKKGLFSGMFGKKK